MSIQFGSPHPPRISNPELLFIGLLAGLVILLVATYVVDRLGTAMFKRGFAKPFYLKGRRIHHNCIYLIIPVCYAVLVSLFFLGYVQPIWNSIWFRLGYIVIVTAAAIAVDFLGDKFWPTIRMNVILHHEWIYTLVPAYIFTYVVNVII